MPIYKDPNVPSEARYLHFKDFVRLTADTIEGGIACIYNGYAKPYPLPGRSIKKMTDMGNYTEVHIECCLGLDMGTYALDTSVQNLIEVLEREGLPVPEIVEPSEMQNKPALKLG